MASRDALLSQNSPREHRIELENESESNPYKRLNAGDSGDDAAVALNMTRMGGAGGVFNISISLTDSSSEARAPTTSNADSNIISI